MNDVNNPTIVEFFKQLEGTPCVILGSPDAGGVYDNKGNCIVPFRFTRPDGIFPIEREETK